MSRLCNESGAAHDIRTLELDWPDTPMRHGYAGEELHGLKEYLGEPSEMLLSSGSADIW